MIIISLLLCTLNLDVDGVVVILNAMHHLTAIGARVPGAQLCHLHGNIGGDGGVVDEVDPIQVVRLHPDLAIRGHQDEGHLALVDVAPLDAVG